MIALVQPTWSEQCRCSSDSVLDFAASIERGTFGSSCRVAGQASDSAPGFIRLFLLTILTCRGSLSLNSNAPKTAEFLMKRDLTKIIICSFT
ncbi:hypothetical protein CDAR_79691 [Caerostris darwini]|uniref:Uncharacterized protein n=1 Tax=Caerostris darwini TaxID=1538125 RepID=A0AAV4SAI8_9ARAC|nr:hypothetical protein CDAR_74501 [Caerostris darwini]GIY34126.1 hypothetical protein CDAR_79691 [Caerostris darwini]